MTIQVPDDLRVRIESRIAQGTSETIGEVLRKALDALDSQELEILAIQKGVDDLDAGRVTPLREFDWSFRERHKIPSDA